MKKPKPKTCKAEGCPNTFIPYLSTQKVCSPKCAINWAGKKMAEDKKKETRKMRRAMNEKDRSYQLKKAQEAFNGYIRERDKDNPCISCGTTDPNLRYDAGHYRTIGAHPELRFEEDNCFRQCHYNCNIMRSGNVVDYRIGLVRRIGGDRVAWLEGNHEPKHYTLEEIKSIKLKYRRKLKELREKAD